MIYTASYRNAENIDMNKYSISWDKGKDAGYFGECYLELAPKLDFFRIWKSQRETLSFLENTKYYINEYYNRVLKYLDPIKVYELLDNSILLCYEEPCEFCHRHIVASWLKETINKDVKEIQLKDNKIIEIERPNYIDEILREIMGYSEK